MLDAEAALARALAVARADRRGARRRRSRRRAAPSASTPPRSRRARPASGNPVVPLKAALTDAVEGPAAGHVHRGATSQDILDTAAMLVTARALEPLLEDLGAAASAAAELARAPPRHADGGADAAPAGGPGDVRVEGRGLARGARRTRAAGSRRSALERLAAQLGGAAGTLASLGDAGPQVVARLRRGARARRAGPALAHAARADRRARVGARRGLGRGRQGRARHRPALADRGRRGPGGQGRRVFDDAAQAQPGRGDLRARLRAAGAGARRDPARRDGPRARARGGRVARGVAPAGRAAALDRLGRRVAARVARGARGRPGADAREPRR